MRASMPAAFLVLTGCLFTETAEGPDAGPKELFCESSRLIPTYINRKVDILFVMDTSPSMADNLATIQDNIGRFANVLVNIEGGLPDIQVGFITADLGAGTAALPGCTAGGDGAALQVASNTAGCPAPSDPYLRDLSMPFWLCPENEPNCRDRNYDGSFGDALACMVPLRSDGCEVSQPLAATLRALDGSVPGNAGFLRDDAFLLVVIVTDGDDCSDAGGLFEPGATPVDAFRCVEHGVSCDGGAVGRSPASYSTCEPASDSLTADVTAIADAIKQLKGDPALTIVSVIGGPPAPFEVIDDGGPALASSCVGFGGAIPSIRLDAFAEQFPQRSTFTSACQQDLAEAFLIIAELNADVLGLPCVDAVATDTDPANPGDQLDCVVSFFDLDGVEHLLPSCAMEREGRPAATTDLPCWWTALPEYDDPYDSCPYYGYTEGLGSSSGNVEFRCVAECR